MVSIEIGMGAFVVREILLIVAGHQLHFGGVAVMGLKIVLLVVNSVLVIGSLRVVFVVFTLLAAVPGQVLCHLGVSESGVPAFDPSAFEVASGDALQVHVAWLDSVVDVIGPLVYSRLFWLHLIPTEGRPVHALDSHPELYFMYIHHLVLALALGTGALETFA